MPRISEFFGIIITMYYNDRTPPHFHAIYGGDEAKIAIETFETLDGKLPRRALAMVLEWGSLHRRELRANWNKARRGEPLKAIEPLG